VCNNPILQTGDSLYMACFISLFKTSNDELDALEDAMENGPSW
jgi:hypothetical protein